jgi:Xaa-Pro dipeptidase
MTDLAALNIHFAPEEFAARRRAALALMQERGLDGLLLFRQESMYYLTGYDTFGYVYVQCLWLGADGRMTLLTRAPDRLQAKFTSVIENIRIWTDQAGAEPFAMLKDILAGHGAAGKRLGVEWEAYGLTARNGQRLAAALDGFCTLADASDLVSRLRVVKSPAELAYVRRAAELADDALAAAEDTAAPGAFEGDILAAMQSAVFRGGGDDPANEYIIGSGPGALMCRYYTGRRHLGAKDMLTLEFAGAYRHYHACLMRTFAIGEADPRLIDMHKACADDQRLNACGYSLGTTFAPNWMDWPMLYHGNDYEARPGNVFFLHMILFDEPNGLAMTLGRTCVVTETGTAPLSRAPLDLVVK